MVLCTYCERTADIELSLGSLRFLSRDTKHTDLEAKRNEQHGNSSPDVWSNLHLKPFLNHIVLRGKKQEEKWNETDTIISSLTFIKISSLPKITGLKRPQSYIFPRDRNPPLHPTAPAQLPLLTGSTRSLAQSLC